jgi:hypothetical protein
MGNPQYMVRRSKDCRLVYEYVNIKRGIIELERFLVFWEKYTRKGDELTILKLLGTIYKKVLLISRFHNFPKPKVTISRSYLQFLSPTNNLSKWQMMRIEPKAEKAGSYWPCLFRA